MRSRISPSRQQRIAALVAAIMLFAAPLATADDVSPGERIFMERCADCHGSDGQGVEGVYSQPLIGDASVVELAKIIDKTMPEGAPEECVGEDAHAVAEYIHAAFYGPLAQIRNRPPRVELSRLTVRQYRETVADLIGSFRGGPGQSDEQGLKAEYFASERFRGDDRKLERVDPVVNFDFGEGSPEIPDVTIDPKSFAIRWSGSITPPETGEYEFIIRTKNGVQLWLNDERKPLIDGRVRSGEDIELRERIFLLGGRSYRLRMDFFKSERGKEKTAAIKLLWKPPQREEEIVPARFLAPHWSPETFIVSTPFPPDDRSVGYERGTAISAAWDEATTDAALATAGYVADHLHELAGIRGGRRDRDNDDERKAKQREFLVQFVERAFRRPLNDEERNRYVDQQLAATDDPELGVKRVVLLALKSPRFLYRELEGAPNDPWNVASRLSFTLWDSLPDAQLRDAAAQDQLRTEEQVRRQIDRMVNDPRTTAKLREFMRHWLRLDHLTDIAKDSEAYPEFTPEVIADLRTSLDLFVDEVLGSDQPSLKQLLLDDQVWLNGRLARLYGADLPEDAEFQKVSLPGQNRAGVLTHPLLMAGFAYTSTSSPIHRGVFLSRSVLGRALKAPPIAVSPTPPDLHPDLTTRQRVEEQTSPDACRSCHGMINPLGFSLENFDAVGRYRTEEQGKPINAKGSYLNRAGEIIEFDGSRGLAEFIAASPETHEAFVRQLFEHLVKQPLPAYGIDKQAELRKIFQQKDLNLRALAAEIANTVGLVDESLETAVLPRPEQR